MIRLFDKNETNFNHNKYVLNECLLSKVTETTDGIFDLDLEYPLKDNKNLSGLLIRGNIIKCPISTTDPRGEQLFTIRSRKPITHENKVVIYAQAKARRDLDLNMVVGMRTTPGMTRKQACELLLSKCVEQQGYTIGNLDTNTNTNFNLGLEEKTGNPINYLDINGISPRKALLDDSQNSIVKAWGGEIIYNNFEINMVDERGKDHSFEIRSGKNLEELEQSIDDTDTENLATAILPCSSDGYYLPNSEIIYSPNANVLGKIFQKITFDDVSLKANTPEGLNTLYDQLRERAQKKFDDGLDKLKINNTVKFTQLSNTEEYKDFKVLEKCEIGNNVTIKYYYPYDLQKKTYIEATGRVLKIVFNVLTNRIEEVEIGDRKKQSIITTINNTVTNTTELNDKHNQNKIRIKEVEENSRDYANGLKVILEKRDTEIEASVTNLQTDVQAKILVMDGEIDDRVTKGDYGSFKKQTLDEIDACVKTDNLSSEMRQRADSIVEAIRDATGSHEFILDSSGGTFKNGGLKVQDKNGNTVMTFTPGGIAVVKDLELENGALEKGSYFYTALANMEQVFFQNMKAGSAIIPSDTYISDFGGTLEEYIRHVAKN